VIGASHGETGQLPARGELDAHLLISPAEVRASMAWRISVAISASLFFACGESIGLKRRSRQST